MLQLCGSFREAALKAENEASEFTRQQINRTMSSEGQNTGFKPGATIYC